VKADGAHVKNALDEAMLRRRGRRRIAEPEGWWNMYAIGPIQATGIPRRYAPDQSRREALWRRSCS
jgi:hypothetical protein